MASIKDIAKRAGVSISTVSYALNGNSKVTKETADRILKIAEELQYVPHAAARLLKTKKSYMIGIFLKDFSGSFYGDLLQGVKEYLSLQGYDLLVCSGQRSRRLLPEKMIDGAIVLDESFPTTDVLQYADQGHKIIVLDRELQHPNISQVLLDNQAGAALAIEYLMEQGHQHFYIVTGPKHTYDAEQRLHAARKTLTRNGITDWVELDGDFTKQTGITAAEHIVAHYTKPCAVFCLNDEMAAGVHHYVKHSSPYIIGEQISVIGFDHTELSQFIEPALATIYYSMRKWGTIASQQLLKVIGNETVENERIYVSLVPGSSVANIADHT
ncbi:LacI family DNA-binding transcriptional regulator [Paenibacillus yanchengensis]|uniref:LacI family DNA-binding transcriptional regulator n=1 Tax=Paenibacillus yanchengensis TaxID=2035833 RepID=A0ABW4YQF9_9BACL